MYALRPTRSSVGEGIGRLSKTTSTAEFAAQVRNALKCGPVQTVGDGERPIERVAVACGAAGEFLTDAARQRVDAFLTGEMRFHDYLAAQGAGRGPDLAGTLCDRTFRGRKRWPSDCGIAGRECTSSASQREVDPVTWV